MRQQADGDSMSSANLHSQLHPTSTATPNQYSYTSYWSLTQNYTNTDCKYLSEVQLNPLQNGNQRTEATAN